MTTWRSSTGNEYPVPKTVDVEGLRMQIPSPESPLARWRINLRECLSYTTLVTCPDMVSFDMNKDWTDMQCTERLTTLQETHNLRKGTIPASVFAVAITHFTSLALHEGQKASESIEDDSHYPPLCHENVDELGLRPRLLAGKLVRNKKILFLTDSGALIYRKPDSKGKSK